MEHPFSILMLFFSAMLFVYAGLTALSKKLLLPKSKTVSAQIDDMPAYARKFAVIIAIVACCPLLSGVVGLFAGDMVAAIILGVTLIAAIWSATVIIGKKQ